MVNRADSLLIIEGVDADDYVHLGGALVYHTDIDVAGGECGEYGRGGAVAGSHIVTDGRNQRQSAVNVDVVGIELYLCLRGRSGEETGGKANAQ